MLFFGDPDRTKEEFMKWFLQDIREAKYAEEVENGVLDFIDDLIEGRIEVRAHTSKNIHAKFYLFLPENHSEHSLNQISPFLQPFDFIPQISTPCFLLNQLCRDSFVSTTLGGLVYRSSGRERRTQSHADGECEIRLQ